MSSISRSFLAIATITCTPVVIHAQSESALVGWAGLVNTPVGAFAPVITGRPTSGNRSFGLQVRTSQWQFSEFDDNTRNIGLGAVLNRGRTRTVLELGAIKKKDCGECDVFMAGLDMRVDLAHSIKGRTTYLVAANPALGYGVPSEGSGNAFSIGLSVPVSASINAGSSVRLVPFLSPGYGGARFSGGGESETGSRAMLAGGLSLGGQKSAWLVTASARKIFLEEAPTIYGIGFTMTR